MADRKAWTREESVVACALYAVTPYNQIQSHNPQVVAVAEKLGRSPASLAMRMTMYAGLDPVSQAKGHKGFDATTKQDREVFAEFQKDWKSIMAQAEAIVGPLHAED